jgi:molecular chaperone DnaJ
MPNEIFERDGRDLYFEAPIPFDIAVLGGTINVPGLESKIALKIPSYTQTGKIFRIKEKELLLFEILEEVISYAGSLLKPL